jgi:hypothetical protein
MKWNIQKWSITLALVCGLNSLSMAQANEAAIANADSSRFSPNRQGGWQLLNSFVATVGAGNAQLELIIENSTATNLGQSQFLGTIKGANLFPSTPVSLTFNILKNQYQINIRSDGRCYIKLLNGSPPSSNPTVIPLRVIYKL